MMIRYSVPVRRARAAATMAFIDSSPTPAKLLIYSGPIPPPGVIASQPPLISFTLSNPVGTLTDDGVLIVPPPETVLQRTGVPTWARIFNGAESLIGDVDVGDKNSDAVLKLNVVGDATGAVMLYAGGLMRMPSMILR